MKPPLLRRYASKKRKTPSLPMRPVLAHRQGRPIRRDLGACTWTNWLLEDDPSLGILERRERIAALNDHPRAREERHTKPL